MAYLDIHHGYSLQSAVAAGTGSAIDNRNGAAYAMLQYFSTGNSAIIDLMVATEGNMYMTAASYTATNGVTGSAQIAAYYPFVRADLRGQYAGTTATLFYAGGLK